MVKTKKKGENYHDRHAVLYLGFTLTVLGRQQFFRIRNSEITRFQVVMVAVQSHQNPDCVAIAFRPPAASLALQHRWAIIPRRR